MPYVNLPSVEIRITIPDFVIDDTVIKREAYCSKMVYDNDAKSVSVYWVVQHFSVLADGTKGSYIGNNVPDYIRVNIADNSTMCDVTTGIPVYPDANGDYDPAVDYTGQYDFFNNMGENTPILVNQVIKNFGLLITDWNKK